MAINQTAMLPLPIALWPVGKIYFNSESDSNLWSIHITFINNLNDSRIPEFEALENKELLLISYLACFKK